jgi:hypothetical protein
MMWQVSDNGRIEMKLRASGERAVRASRQEADRYVGNIVGDLSATLGIEVTTNELRYSINKNRPEVTVTWRAQVPVETVPDVREYLARLAQSEHPVQGEVVSREDDVPDQ